MKRQPRQFNITRDLVLFVGGFAGVLYETLFEQVDRPALLVVFGGMMGLPAFLRRDERVEPTPPQPPNEGSHDGSGNDDPNSAPAEPK